MQSIEYIVKCRVKNHAMAASRGRLPTKDNAPFDVIVSLQGGSQKEAEDHVRRVSPELEVIVSGADSK